MAHGAQCFPERISYFRRLGVEIELFGEGLIPDMVAALARREGAATSGEASEVIREVPPARPRRKAIERLPIVTFKWKGHIPYEPDDVRIWGNQVSRNLSRDHHLVCITDDPEELREASDNSQAPGWPEISYMTMWRDRFEHGRDWHRLKLFAEEMADTIGPRFVVMDLDTVICGALDPLFDNDHPFMAWQDPNRDQYCTALTMMDAGAYPHVWHEFDAEKALSLRHRGIFGGYDQAWISYMLPGMPRWTAEDGVLSFRVDLLRGHSLQDAHAVGAHILPPHARIVNFHGKYNPRDAEVQAALPWVKQHWI
jgi:hypothetical protein